MNTYSYSVDVYNYIVSCDLRQLIQEYGTLIHTGVFIHKRNSKNVPERELHYIIYKYSKHNLPPTPDIVSQVSYSQSSKLPGVPARAWFKT